VATLILLRHGRTTSNAGGTLAVGQRLAAAGLPLAAVVTSPLLRCRQTVELALPGAVPEVDERLTECGYGDWEGQPLKTLAKQPLWQVVQAHPSAARFPSGESMAAMSVRAVAAVREWDARLAAEHGPEAVWLACSHGDVIKAIVADALGLHLDLFQRIAVDPASVTVIRYTPLRPFLLRANDTGGDLSGLRPPKRRSRRRPASDAVVGGGAGPTGRRGAAGTDRIGSTS
jgi:probable phosphomutase (TIGR03848 family)